MDTSKGIYGKYIVQKADGSEIDPDAIYFVLRLDKDPFAQHAIHQMISQMFREQAGGSEYCKQLMWLMTLVDPKNYKYKENSDEAKQMVSRKEQP